MFARTLLFVRNWPSSRKWRPIAQLSVVFLFTLVVAAPGGHVSDSPVISPTLHQALAAGQKDAEYKVWVHFQDRALMISDIGDALDQAESNLTTRAARRRAKMHTPGERLVDVRDLPLNPALLERCQKTGARLQKQSRWLNAASFYADAHQITQLARVPGDRKSVV